MAETKLEGVGMSTAHQELAALRTRTAELEAKLRAEAAPAVAGAALSLEAARAAVAEKFSAAGAGPVPAQTDGVEGTPVDHLGAVTLKLSPEAHDEKMGELIGILQTHGVSAAIAAAEASGSPHIMDDFERVLVEYVHEGLSVKKMPRAETPLAKALGLSLLEVTLPAQTGAEREGGDPTKDMRGFIALMEQFYRGTLSLGNDAFFSFELANAAGASATSAYIAVPAARRDLFEKQLAGLYPTARITEVPDDYNIFAPQAAVAARVARFTERPIFALRTAEEMPNDPMDILLSAFSKLDRAREGAAVQFVIQPGDRKLGFRFRRALERVRDGIPVGEAAKAHGKFGEFLYEVRRIFVTKEKYVDVNKRPGSEDPRVKAIERKIASPVLHANIRIIASAATPVRAESILSDIEAPFHQLADTAGGNALKFISVPARGMRKFTHAFSYRLFDAASAMPLSAAELAALAHPPRPESREGALELHQEKNIVAAAPADLPQEGTLLGVNRFRGTDTNVYLLPEDRLRHLYLIGQTGTGKSNLLKNIILQDIKAGSGVCFIDPHGSDVLDILSAIPPERARDVIYFDPGATERPMALNMLEYDASRPEQKTLVVDELFGIFKKLFGAVPESMGPAFEQYFRNAALLVMDDPSSGNTLLDISKVFADEEFRALKLSRCQNPIVKQFWEKTAAQATGEQSLANYGPYVTNKFDVFTTNEIMRPIIAQQHSSFNIRQVMDERKILLVNLAKGKLGEINSNLLGLIIVGKFLLAALSRTGASDADLPPFYLSIDEFQNFTTPSIATIFSEARKYKLSLTVAHQFIAQLEDEIKDAVFGNVGSLVSFRVGAEDAEFLEKQFAPVFKQADLMRVDNYRAFARLLSRGAPVRPFSIETYPFISGTVENRDALRELSLLTYGRPREEIENAAATAQPLV